MEISIVTIFFLALIYAWIVWRKPVLGLWILIIALPSYQLRFSLYGIPGTQLEVLLLVLCGVSAIKYKKEIINCIGHVMSDVRTNLWDWIRTPEGVTVLLLKWIMLASVLSLLVTPTLREGLGIWKAYIIEPILLALILQFIVREKKHLRFLLTAVMALVMTTSLVCMVQYLTGWGLPAGWSGLNGTDLRAVGLYSYPNAVGLLLAPLTALCFAVLIHGKALFEYPQPALSHALAQVNAPAQILIALYAAVRAWVQQLYWKYIRVALGVTAVFGAMAVILARADGAVIAIAASIGVTLLFTQWRNATLITGILGLLAALSIPATRAILLFKDTSGDVRLALWQGTWNLLMAQPIYGAGLAAFPATYYIYRLPSHTELLEYAHNLLLDFWVQLGVLGLIWIIAIIGIGFYVTARKTALAATHNLSLIPLAVLTSFVVYGLVDVPYFKNDLSIIFWMTLVSFYTVTQVTHVTKKA